MNSLSRLHSKIESLTNELAELKELRNAELIKNKKLIEKIKMTIEIKNNKRDKIQKDIRMWVLQKSKSTNPNVRLIGGYDGRSSYYAVAEFSTIKNSIDFPAYPTLHNKLLKFNELGNEIENLKSQIKKLRLATKIKALDKKIIRIRMKISDTRKLIRLAGIAKIPKMNIENWEDAETFAVVYMRWLGFTDAKKTNSGSDEGKDVDSSIAVAQVKDMGTGVSRPMLQQLFGVAAAEKKIPVFFARSYAKTAKEWGQKHGMALFQFSIRGDVKAVSTKAEQILKKK